MSATCRQDMSHVPKCPQNLIDINLSATSMAPVTDLMNESRVGSCMMTQQFYANVTGNDMIFNQQLPRKEPLTPNKR